jgi:hypothetical protein
MTRAPAVGHLGALAIIFEYSLLQLFFPAYYNTYLTAVYIYKAVHIYTAVHAI